LELVKALEAEKLNDVKAGKKLLPLLFDMNFHIMNGFEDSFQKQDSKGTVPQVCR